MTFSDLRLSEPILRAVAAEGYSTPTPIQAKAIPHVLTGVDLLGCAQTGTGKTAAFALPILHLLTQGRVRAAAGAEGHPLAEGGHVVSHGHSHGHGHGHGPARGIRTLILSPTRELAVQIGDSFKVYGKHTGIRYTVIYGGVGQRPQVDALRRGVDVVIATPGRLLDLMQQRHVNLGSVEIFVLDEADRMLDMGFIEPIREIVSKIPVKRQTLMFSATMPPEIRRLAATILRSPISVEVAPVSSAAETVEQSVHFVAKKDKGTLLLRVLREGNGPARTLVFTRTKHGADKVVKLLLTSGIRAEAIHGNKRQNVRQKALDSFKSGRTPVLVATDIAARGIDVDNIALVINFDVPHEPETYVHRIGRTGRAGASGRATSFCDYEERGWLRGIERLIRRPIAVAPAERPHAHEGRHVPAPVAPPIAAHAPAHAKAEVHVRPVAAAKVTTGGHGSHDARGSHARSGSHGGHGAHDSHAPRTPHARGPKPKHEQPREMIETPAEFRRVSKFEVKPRHEMESKPAARGEGSHTDPNGRSAHGHGSGHGAGHGGRSAHSTRGGHSARGGKPGHGGSGGHAARGGHAGSGGAGGGASRGGFSRGGQTGGKPGGHSGGQGGGQSAGHSGQGGGGHGAGPGRAKGKPWKGPGRGLGRFGGRG